MWIMPGTDIDVRAMRVYGAFPEMTNPHACPIPSGVIVQGDCMSDDVQVRYGYPSSVTAGGHEQQAAYISANQGEAVGQILALHESQIIMRLNLNSAEAE